MTKHNLQCRQFESDGITERQVVSQTVLEILGSNDQTDPFTRAAMVMVGAAFVGPNVDRLVQLTPYTQEHVDQIAIRLKASGMWKEATLDYDPQEASVSSRLWRFPTLIPKAINVSKSHDLRFEGWSVQVHWRSIPRRKRDDDSSPIRLVDGGWGGGLGVRHEGGLLNP